MFSFLISFHVIYYYLFSQLLSTLKSNVSLQLLLLSGKRIWFFLDQQSMSSNTELGSSNVYLLAARSESQWSTTWVDSGQIFLDFFFRRLELSAINTTCLTLHAVIQFKTILTGDCLASEFIRRWQMLKWKLPSCAFRPLICVLQSGNLWCKWQPSKYLKSALFSPSFSRLNISSFPYLFFS